MDDALLAIRPLLRGGPVVAVVVVPAAEDEKYGGDSAGTVVVLVTEKALLPLFPLEDAELLSERV